MISKLPFVMSALVISNNRDQLAEETKVLEKAFENGKAKGIKLEPY